MTRTENLTSTPKFNFQTNLHFISWRQLQNQINKHRVDLTKLGRPNTSASSLTNTDLTKRIDLTADTKKCGDQRLSFVATPNQVQFSDT
ncbi:MAG: hypothetical protein ACK50L_06275 [Bacteroidota bacterium]